MNDQTTSAHPDIPENLAEIQEILLDWYRQNARDLPWRRTRNPYQILVSEVMLQQTQVDRVIPRYHSFLEAFPTVEALASAPTSAVIRLWSGLGYNRRAINLQRAAQAVVENYGGVFPSDVKQLQTLPGIGPYTAGAIACFAFEQDVGFMDTNIRRLLHRLLIGPEVPEEARTQRQMQEIADGIIPPGEGWTWGQSLIEFGAIQCTARKPACLTCPLQRHCASFPEIQSILAELARSGYRRKKEESFVGSNRFFRGRVMRALQQEDVDHTGLDLSRLGAYVRDDYSSEHQDWLRELVAGLERDGLVEISEDRSEYNANPSPISRVRLPGNSPDAPQSG